MTETPTAPRLWMRLAARLHGEVPADQLEAFRRAGGGVFESYLSAEKALTDLAGTGVHPWAAQAGTKSLLLCTWNAYLLQTLASALLDADYRATPSTAGYLPPVTAEQAWALFEQVEPWLSRARQAQHSSSYDVSTPGSRSLAARGDRAAPAPRARAAVPPRSADRGSRPDRGVRRPGRRRCLPA